jgi:voltage-gated potassium channel
MTPSYTHRIIWGLEIFIQAVIFYSLGMYFIELQFMGTEHSLQGHKFFLWSERVVAAIFTTEYLIRWFTFKDKWWKYPLKPMAIVDALAVLPFYVGFFIDLRFLRLVRTLRVLRLLKIYRYNIALQSFVKSYRTVKHELGILMMAIAVLVFFSATAIYECERIAQPQAFTKYSDALWWSIITLTTVGYGDKYPVTEFGRIVATITLVLGLGVFGTFLSLIGSAFVKTIQEKLNVRVWDTTHERLAVICKERGEPIHEEIMQAMIDEAVKSHFGKEKHNGTV